MSTNAQIAERLVVSPHNVERHVEHPRQTPSLVASRNRGLDDGTCAWVVFPISTVWVIARMSRPRRTPTVHASDFAEECTLHARITRRTARAAWRRHPRQRLGRSPFDCSLRASGYRRQALFKGLPHGRCPAPHWGYVIKG